MWLQLVFLVLPIAYFLVYRKYHLQGTLWEDAKSFFGLKKITSQSLHKGLVLFSILFLVSVALNIVFYLIFPQINDLENVSNTLYYYVNTGKIAYFFVMLVIGVFLEEFFFRALLVPRLGVFFSTAAFTLMHVGYGSWIELVGAFILGLILGWYYKKNKDLFVNIYAHLMYNGIAVLFMLLSVM